MLLLTFLSLHNCGSLKFDAETNKMHLDCSVNIFKRLSLQEWKNVLSNLTLKFMYLFFPGSLKHVYPAVIYLHS